MRQELKIIEEIEAYMMDALNPEQKSLFEDKLTNNSELKDQYDFQKDLVEGIQRLGLKNDAIRARKKYVFQKVLKIGAVIILVAALTGFAISQFESASENSEDQFENVAVETINTIHLLENDSLFAEPNTMLDQQFFDLNTKRDTVIETAGGAVIFVPANSFDTDLNEVNFLVQEALKVEDILLAGLSTETMEGDSLESGGMLYFDAFAKDKRIGLRNDLIVDIPAYTDKPEMMFYDGKKMDNGEIKWTNPKPFERPLKAVDILTLDFYPPKYEPKMDEWGYLNKDFKDSLYYSFGDEFGNVSIPDTAGLQELLIGTISPTLMFMPFPQDDLYHSKVQIDSSIAINESQRLCGLNPILVKTIWNRTFNNTNLATKEFEARMPLIHESCDDAILELYIKNLDKKLATVDSMAMRRTSGSLRRKFAAFAKLNQGKVDVSTKAGNKLADYYRKKSKEFSASIKTAQKEFWDEQNDLDQKYIDQNAKANKNSNQSRKDLQAAETKFISDKVYKALDMDKKGKPNNRNIQLGNRGSNTGNVASALIEPEEPVHNSVIVPPSRPIVRANVSNLGWYNVDCLMSLSQMRTTAKIKGNNRTTTVSFAPWQLNIANNEAFDKVTVYMIPKQFTSYVKLYQSNNNYKYSLNNDLAYDVVVIAWSGDNFYASSVKVKGSNQTVQLKQAKMKDWKKSIANNFESITNFSDEIDFQEFVQTDQKRQNTNQAKRDLKRKIRPYIFDCNCAVEQDDIEIVSVEHLSNIRNQRAILASEDEPRFPGGEREMSQFVANNIKLPNIDNLTINNSTVYVSFLVTETGELKNVNTIRGVHPLIDEEVMRVVKSMPKWTPAQQDGKAVAVEFTLPVNVRYN
ncbi:energy transducer TonB [Crocinitomix catalasitica]|uniref:energy transducer TonB n=1 Tax=Crocinitomix catalasitica TaxID=184607 RepID=UPI000684B4AE|nr:energy transducer TonB [Crocinitomix catalasitica]